MSLRGSFVLRLIALVAVVLSAIQVPAQGQGTAPVLDPEDAYLSPTRYTNAYFGFEFDLPPDAQLKPIAMPASLDRRIQLLELLGATPQHAVVSICAYEYKNKNYTDAKGILRRQLDQETFVGVEELHGLAKATIDGRQFYYFETRKGVAQHTVLATELDGYVLVADLQAQDANLLHELRAAFSRAEFFPVQEAKQYAGPGAAFYQGPAISSQHLREVKAAAPAEHLDGGKIDGNVYRNAQIGIMYEFPTGWSVQPEGAIEPSVERYRERVTGEPLLGPRERAVVKACRRTLLSVWRTKPTATGEVPYDEFGEVTLSAMPLSCFPNISFPDDPRDAGAIRRFIVGLSLTQPLQRDMNDARTYEAGGKLFVLTHGTIAYKEEGDSLSRRVSVAMAMTQHRGYLLIWLIAAPHDAELRELLAAKVGFDSDIKSSELTLPNSPHGAPHKASTGQTPAPSPNAAGEPDTAKTEPLAHASGNADPPATPAAGPPSLLRAGESLQDQQMAGKPQPAKQPKPN